MAPSPLTTRVMGRRLLPTSTRTRDRGAFGAIQNARFSAWIRGFQIPGVTLASGAVVSRDLPGLDRILQTDVLQTVNSFFDPQHSRLVSPWTRC